MGIDAIREALARDPKAQCSCSHWRRTHGSDGWCERCSCRKFRDPNTNLVLVQGCMVYVCGNCSFEQVDEKHLQYKAWSVRCQECGGISHPNNWRTAQQIEAQRK